MANTQPETVQFVTRVNRFEPFYGANHKMMQRLLTGIDPKTKRHVDVPRTLVSPKRLQELRLGRIGSEADQNRFRSNYIDTSLAVLPDPNSNEFTFSHRHPLIYNLNEETELVGGGNLPIDPDVYAEAKKNGFTISASDANTLRNNIYDLKNKRREAWEFFAEGDTETNNAYVSDVTKTLGLEFDNVMGVDLPRNKGLRLLNVGSVNYSSSNASGYYNDLGDEEGRLLGEAPEVQVEQSKISLDDRVEFSYDGSVVKVDGKTYMVVPQNVNF